MTARHAPLQRPRPYRRELRPIPSHFRSNPWKMRVQFPSILVPIPVLLSYPAVSTEKFEDQLSDRPPRDARNRPSVHGDAMDIELTDDQRAIEEGVKKVTARFGDDY